MSAVSSLVAMICSVMQHQNLALIAVRSKGPFRAFLVKRLVVPGLANTVDTVTTAGYVLPTPDKPGY